MLNVLARLGAGFDIVSRGELERVLAAGGDPAKVVNRDSMANPASFDAFIAYAAARTV